MHQAPNRGLPPQGLSAKRWCSVYLRTKNQSKASHMQAVRMSFPVLDTLQWTSLAIKLPLQTPQISHGAAKTPSQLPLIKNSRIYESAYISSFDKMNPWM